MKKVYILALLVCFSSFVFAQKLASKGAKLETPNFINSVKTPTDTLYPYGIENATGLTLYGSEGGGFVTGNNGYGDIAKAQAFAVAISYKVEAALIWVGAKKIVGTAGNLVVSINNCTGAGTATTGAVNNAPSTQLSSVTISMLDIDTTGDLTVATFPSPVIVASEYAIVLSFATASFGNDTIGIVSCMSGDPGTTETSWEKWNDNSWHTLAEGWAAADLTLDMVILPVVDQSTAGIESHDFFDGIKFSAYPNPAANNTKIHYELANQAKVQMDIIDITGKIVMTIDEGNQTRGQHSVSVSTEKMNSGSYFISLKADGKRLTKRLIINK